ncbi:hypothetical protein FQZ97_746440 [compost metagenome]
MGGAGHRGRRGSGAGRAVGLSGGGCDGIRAGQPDRGRLHLGDDLPDDDPDRLARRARRGQEAAGAGAHAGGQLADQALHHGRAGRAVLPAHLCALGRSTVGQRVHRRHDLAGCSAVHRHGLCVEPARQRRRQLHAGAGVDQRPHHGGGLRPHRGLTARRDQRDRAVGNAAAVHAAVRRAAPGGRHAHAPATAAAWTGGGAGFCGRAQAVVGGRVDRHGGAAVRFSGRDHRAPAAGDPVDRGAAGAAELRHLLHCMVGRTLAQAAAQRGRPGLSDRHLQLLRAGGGRGHFALRIEFRRRTGHRGRRADRGAGDAVAGGLGQRLAPR